MNKVIDDRQNHWTFWLRHCLKLRTWYIFACECALITPSSATVERLFSLLTQGFGSDRESSLNDYAATSVAIRYNNNFKKGY